MISSTRVNWALCGVPGAVGVPYKSAGTSTRATKRRPRRLDAVALKDLISPYLLRRLKQDLDINLPDKTEQVLFCPMTENQRAIGFSSREVEDIIDGRREALGGIDVLRKIVNHPDLLERNSRVAMRTTAIPCSGKLQVALKILSMWKVKATDASCFHKLNKCWTY